MVSRHEQSFEKVYLSSYRNRLERNLRLDPIPWQLGRIFGLSLQFYRRMLEEIK